MKSVAIIGGTGTTGQCAVDYALSRRLIVRLLYRNEDTLPQRFKDKVQLVHGNVINYEDCKRAVEGVNAVVIILGARNNPTSTNELSTGTANLIKAMKESNVKRFSIIMSSFLLRPISEVPAVFHRLSKEHRRMLDLTLASELEYIAILPSHISDEPPSGYSIAYDKVPGPLISKYDLARFAIHSLKLPEHFGKVCGIAKKNTNEDDESFQFKFQQHLFQ